MRPDWTWRAAVAAVALVALVGCGSADGGEGGANASPAPGVSAAVVSVAVLKPGQPVPAVTDEPVLTLAGRITRTNQAAGLALDLGLLDRLGVSKVELFEPNTKQDMAFQGIWLADLLKIAGADPAATSVRATALDDYVVNLTMADIRAGGIFLATRDGQGKPIPIDEGGPTRIVFVGGVPSGKSDDQWIWSLRTLDVR